MMGVLLPANGRQHQDGETMCAAIPPLPTPLDAPSLVGWANEVDVPLVRAGRQGDVLVIPDDEPTTGEQWRRPVPPAGVAVVEGRYGGHTHLLIAEGDVRYATAGQSDDGGGDPQLQIGTLEVAQGAVAFLVHPEHRAIGFRPGRYAVLRQGEDGGERLVYVID